MTLVAQSATAIPAVAPTSTAGTAGNVQNASGAEEILENAQSGAPGPSKRRMSLFSFGSSSSPASTTAKNRALPALSTSPSTSAGSAGFAPPTKSPSMRSPSIGFAPKTTSPVISPVSETDQLSENPDSHIFERSVQDVAANCKHEDCIPPALDATASIFSDSSADLDNVEMVYSSRRNSSVIGLNMALGRPYTPSRKNSMYSVSHLTQNKENATVPAPFSGMNFQPISQQSQQPQSPAQTQSPVSPPKLMTSRSSVSFYSYADMISNDEFSRRPSLLPAYSHGVLPTLGRKMSVASTHSASGGVRSAGSGADFNKTQSQLSKQFRDRSQSSASASKPNTGNFGKTETGEGTSAKKFLISPESSDSEDQDDAFRPSSALGRRPLSRRKSVASNASLQGSLVDDDSFVSSSVGDCIRQSTTEIGNV